MKPPYLLCNEAKAFVWPVALVRLSQDGVERLPSDPVVAEGVGGHHKRGDVHLNTTRGVTRMKVGFTGSSQLNIPAVVL